MLFMPIPSSVLWYDAIITQVLKGRAIKLTYARCLFFPRMVIKGYVNVRNIL